MINILIVFLTHMLDKIMTKRLHIMIFKKDFGLNGMWYIPNTT